MAKKTFEATIKTTITLTELQHNFFWTLRYEYRDEAAFKTFNKNYDWDALLNSTKFNKYVTKLMIEDNDSGFICEQFFMDNSAVYNKIEKAYLKVAAGVKKKYPIIKSEYRVVLHGTKAQLEEARSYLKDMNVVEVIEAL